MSGLQVKFCFGIQKINEKLNFLKSLLYNISIFFCRGKRFPMPKHEGLSEILNDENTIILYPSPNSIPLDELPQVGQNGQKPYNVILLDGTWPQAKV